MWVNGSFGLLQRAALNMVLNAVKFSPENAVVNVKLGIVNLHAVISVINAGPGISKNEQLFLFKRFSRIDGTSTEREGTGLGLYFVQTVADKHHGYADVDSDIGKNTCFTLRIPMLSFNLSLAD